MGIDIIGQKKIVDYFIEMNKRGSLGHAYALCGPSGTGKRTVAGELSKMLLCYATTQESPCGICNACRTFDAGSNPNFTVITSKTQNILIEQIRMLIEDIGIKPPAGRKVYLIEDADRMTPQAQNCLLKTLEEPPSYAVIIMTVTNFESLLITIRSRVVQQNLQRYSDKEMARILERQGIDTNSLNSVVSLAGGIPGKAISIARNANFSSIRDMVFRFVFSDAGRVRSECELNQFLSGNKEAFMECMNILETVYRDSLFILSGKTDGLINDDKRDNILEYAQKHSIRELVSKIAQIDEIRKQLKSYLNYQLAVDTLTLT